MNNRQRDAWEVILDAVLAEPDMGSGDESKCLPGWINTMATAYSKNEGYTLSPSAVGALLHTLLAARQRTRRLVKERNEHRNQTD